MTLRSVVRSVFGGMLVFLGAFVVVTQVKTLTLSLEVFSGVLIVLGGLFMMPRRMANALKKIVSDLSLFFGRTPPHA